MVGFCATDADSPYDGDTCQVEGESRWIARWQWGGLIRWATKGSRRKRVYVRGVEPGVYQSEESLEHLVVSRYYGEKLRKTRRNGLRSSVVMCTGMGSVRGIS